MPRYFAEFITGRSSPGLLIILQSLPIAEAIAGVIQVWERTGSEDWVNRIAYLPL